MTSDSLRKLLLSKPGAVESHPFGPEPDVYKVGGRMFALVSAEPGPSLRRVATRDASSLGEPRCGSPGLRQAALTITLKLEPLHGQLLRGQHPCVRAGYHMNKDHWNTVTLDARVAADELADWIDESYSLVVASLSRKARATLRLGA
jgi:predicted DNA-binding protein (MmcQ/YjbR family)